MASIKCVRCEWLRFKLMGQVTLQKCLSLSLSRLGEVTQWLHKQWEVNKNYVKQNNLPAQSNDKQSECIAPFLCIYFYTAPLVCVTHRGVQWDTQRVKGHQWPKFFLSLPSSLSISVPRIISINWFSCRRDVTAVPAIFSFLVFLSLSLSLLALALPHVALILPYSLFRCIHPPLPMLHRPASALLSPIFVSATALLVSASVCPREFGREIERKAKYKLKQVSCVEWRKVCNQQHRHRW